LGSLEGIEIMYLSVVEQRVPISMMKMKEKGEMNEQ